MRLENHTLSSPGLPSLDLLLCRNSSLDIKETEGAVLQETVVPAQREGIDGLTANLTSMLPDHNGASKAATVRRVRGRKSSTNVAKKSVKVADEVVAVDLTDDKDHPEPKAARKPRKPRTKKIEADGQTTLPKGKVTKAGKAPSCAKVVHTAVTEEVSRHFQVLAAAGIPDDSLQLEDAVTRRISWTPPRKTQMSNAQDTENVMEVAVLAGTPSVPNVEEEKSNVFPSLMGHFTFSHGAAKPILVTDEESRTLDAPIEVAKPVTVRKRKLIELVKTNAANAPKTPKPRAPKKKPKTLTEQATSAYLMADSDHDRLDSIFLCDTQSGPQQSTKRVDDDVFKLPLKSRKDTSSKARVSATKGRAVSSLLSPQTALKHANNQEYVFGTSSQLAREESPSLLRDIQQAIRESNLSEELDASFKRPDDAYMASVYGTCYSTYSESRCLWSAAARNADGDLLDIEVVDLSKSSPAMPNTTQGTVGSALMFQPTPVMAKNHVHDRRTPEISVEAEVSRRAAAPTAQGVVGPVEMAIRQELQNDSAIDRVVDHTTLKPPARRRVASVKKRTPKKIDKPDYESYTAADLAKEIASYHFKPVKGRSQMISLLEKCWEGRQRMALGNLGTNAILQTSPSKTVSDLHGAEKSVEPGSDHRKPRGPPKGSVKSVAVAKRPGVRKAARPRTGQLKPSAPPHTPTKGVKQRRTVDDEISDSDGPCTPSPLRRSASDMSTPPLQLELSTLDALDSSPEATSSSDLDDLHQHITRAVKSAPRSKDALRPSWYEKMLMYDPIVLEDLTTWLNTGALAGSGWDGEVSPVEVKAWCLSKSICCLWRENLKGGARARY